MLKQQLDQVADDKFKQFKHLDSMSFGAAVTLGRAPWHWVSLIRACKRMRKMQWRQNRGVVAYSETSEKLHNHVSAAFQAVQRVRASPAVG